MSFLAPLFLIGAAAIGVPIVLHLIRRQAQGQQEFSSLLFLEASPPTMMRRSTIDQWLLLLLRSLAILLLVAAFARPFWRTPSAAEPVSAARRVAILVDVSASMQQEGMWRKAIEIATDTAQSLSPVDTVGLFAFDTRVETIVDLDEERGHAKEALLAGLKSLIPGYRGTDLGAALATVADRLVRSDDEESQDDMVSEVILISDLQAGSQIDRLESFQWPLQCKLTLKTVAADRPGNVSANFLVAKEGDEDRWKRVDPAGKEEEIDQSKLPVRLSHHGDRPVTVTLSWLDPSGKQIGEAEVTKELEPNSSEVVRIVPPKVDNAVLQLVGDHAIFDNQRWVARPPQRSLKLVCIDDPKRLTADSLGYFLEQLPLDDETHRVAFEWREAGKAMELPGVDESPMICGGYQLTEDDALKLREFMEGRGHFLWVLDHPVDDAVIRSRVEACWMGLLGEAAAGIEESTSEEAILERVDFTHPLFRSLADTRFNDFTKIRFWRHRRIEIAQDPVEQGWRVVSAFDDRSPFLIQRSVGQGKLWVMTAGWQPSESQFALSSKFVPVLSALFQQSLPIERSLDGLTIGDRVDWKEGDVWLDSEGKSMNPVEVTGDHRQIQFDRPGFYRLLENGKEQTVAINLPISESDTRRMEADRLERLGVVTSDSKLVQREVEKRRHRQNVELEKEQRLWQWLMIGMVAMLVAETLWASRRQGEKG